MKMGTEFWVAHVAAARLESISAAKYARQNGISVAALYYWQSKLKANNQTPVAEPAGKFVALRVAESVAELRSCHCVLALPSGLQLSMSSLPNPEWLAALARTVLGAH